MLRLIPADPSLSLKCRNAAARERGMVASWEGDAGYDTTKPIRAVDLPEGFSVVGYWKHDSNEPSGFVVGDRSSPVDWGWYGSHTNAGVAFEDGRKAVWAVLDCVS